MSLLTALGYYMGSQGKAKRENAAAQSTNAYNQGQLDLERQRITQEDAPEQRARTKFNEEEADRTRQLTQDATNKQQDASLKPLPISPAFTKMSPAQQKQAQIAYLRSRQREAQLRGNADLFTQTQQQINSLQAEIDKEQSDALKAAEMKRILDIQPQQFTQGLAEKNAALQDANIRAANSQAGAWDRIGERERYEDTRQQRAFDHSDRNKKAKSGTASLDPRLKYQVQLLEADVKHTLAQNPGASLSDIRAGALKQGYPPEAVDALLGKAPRLAPLPVQRAPGGNPLQQFWSNLMKP